ncbi:MAG: DUF5672 family protein [Parabacteroides merdae]
MKMFFWATEANGFTYPKVKEAIRFSFDKYPGYCYKLNNRQLPFGCHSWYKRKMKNSGWILFLYNNINNLFIKII